MPAAAHKSRRPRWASLPSEAPERQTQSAGGATFVLLGSPAADLGLLELLGLHGLHHSDDDDDDGDDHGDVSSDDYGDDDDDSGDGHGEDGGNRDGDDGVAMPWYFK